MSLRGRLFEGKFVGLDERSLTVGGSWQPNLVDGVSRAHSVSLLKLFYEQMLQFAGPNVLDIGASTGSFSLLAVHHPDAAVVAFEPNPVIHEVLESNLDLNGLIATLRATAVRAAVSDKKGMQILKVPSAAEESGLASMGSRPLRYSDYENVRVWCTTIDLAVHPTFDVHMIKIDTEGCELRVLLGGEQTIRRCKPVIFTEYHETNCAQFGYSHREIKSLLVSWGATCRKVTDEDLMAYWKD